MIPPQHFPTRVRYETIGTTSRGHVRLHPIRRLALRLATAVICVITEVQSRSLCAAPAVMATLSSLPGANALRRAALTLDPQELT